MTGAGAPSPDAAIRRVLERIEAACGRAGRAAADVRLIAVSKSFPAERVRSVLGSGHDLFGENRVQEALSKMDEIGPGARWHLIGALQRNKARHVVGRFELLHGVDGEPLARELERRSAAASVRQPILIQLNLAGEPTKAGLAPEELPPLLDTVATMEHLELRGLMTIPPPPATAEDSRVWFARLREERDRAAGRFGRRLPELSMGMTDDFEISVEEGATLVRVGRAIFGAR